LRGVSILTPMTGVEGSPPLRFERPLRIAVLVKQIPVGEAMSLGADRRLVRRDLELEMNAYCRRAVSKGVEWARASGGTCTVFTLGPPTADDVLREAVAWGADGGMHLCDPAFAGSDTLATARALSAAIGKYGVFDLVLVGRNSLDGDTGQVGPEIAELTGLPFASGVRAMGITGETLSLTLEYDEGWEEAEVKLPALLSVAERLCEPCKVPPAQRSAVADEKIQRVAAADLGEGPWGEAGSPTVVGTTRVFDHHRVKRVLCGDIDDQVSEAVALLVERGALTPSSGISMAGPGRVAEPLISANAGRSAERVIAVMIEPERPRVAAELLGAASVLAGAVGARVHALALATGDLGSLGHYGADEVTHLVGSTIAEDVAAAAVEWSARWPLWAVLGPSTAFGREVLGRMAAALGAGLVGDAIGLEIADGELVAAKPAFSGALVADISCTSGVRMVSVRPGVLPLPPQRDHVAPVSSWTMVPRGRVRVVSQSRDDDVEVLARAETVIGVGAAVLPDEYELLSPLAALLRAELAATRKVTDKGWAPRSRQVGITGRSIAPRLYVALGLSGKFNHVVGARAAGTILAINNDPEALVFGQCDIGIVGDWHVVVPALVSALRHEQTRQLAAAPGGAKE
jgi:electron transfer flavoprotein alpha subunit